MTNNGARTQSITVSSRALGSYRTVKTANVNLSDTASQHMIDWNGVNDNVEPVTFTVPQGVNRLNAAIAFQNASLPTINGRVRLTLIDPAGNLAEYSVPQGLGNYGDDQITNPLPGRWTAYIYSRDSADGGYTGQVVFGASVAASGTTVSGTLYVDDSDIVQFDSFLVPNGNEVAAIPYSYTVK